MNNQGLSIGYPDRLSHCVHPPSGNGWMQITPRDMVDPCANSMRSPNAETIVHSLNLLVVRCRDFEASLFFYTAFGLPFQKSEMGQLMAA